MISPSFNTFTAEWNILHLCIYPVSCIVLGAPYFIKFTLHGAKSDLYLGDFSIVFVEIYKLRSKCLLFSKIVQTR